MSSKTIPPFLFLSVPCQYIRISRFYTAQPTPCPASELPVLVPSDLSAKPPSVPFVSAATYFLSDTYASYGSLKKFLNFSKKCLQFPASYSIIITVRRHSQVVRHGSATPLSPVQIWLSPLKIKQHHLENSNLQVVLFFYSNIFPLYIIHYLRNHTIPLFSCFNWYREKIDK